VSKPERIRVQFRCRLVIEFPSKVISRVTYIG